MNKCFVFGLIITDIDFKFILNGKNDSIVKFSIKLSNNSIINVVSFNEKADFCYRYLAKNDIVFIEGFLDGKMNIITNNIYKI